MTRIPVTLSPHVQKGKPTGYYLVAQRLFSKKVRLLKNQFVGYCDGLVVTVGGIEHLGWDTVLSMAIHLPLLDGRPVNWLSPVKQVNCSGGFRTYLPGKTILMPKDDEEATRMYGEFDSCAVGNGSLFYLRIPLLNGDVLLGRKELRECLNR